jgi:hypothetical protein
MTAKTKQEELSTQIKQLQDDAEELKTKYEAEAASKADL